MFFERLAQQARDAEARCRSTSFLRGRDKTITMSNEINTDANQSEVKPFVVTPEWIADTQKLAFEATKDYVKAKKITRGLVKEQHAGLMVHALAELGLVNNDTESKATAFYALCKLENCSQVRQDLEKSGVLGKATELAAQYY